MYPNRWYSAGDDGEKRRQNRTRWGCAGYDRIIFRIGTNMVRAKRVRWEAFKVINFSNKQKRTPEALAKAISKRCATSLADGEIYQMHQGEQKDWDGY